MALLSSFRSQAKGGIRSALEFASGGPFACVGSATALD